MSTFGTLFKSVGRTVQQAAEEGLRLSKAIEEGNIALRGGGTSWGTAKGRIFSGPKPELVRAIERAEFNQKELVTGHSFNQPKEVVRSIPLSPIEGLQGGGKAAVQRKRLTDFGSPWKGPGKSIRVAGSSLSRANRYYWSGEWVGQLGTLAGKTAKTSFNFARHEIIPGLRAGRALEWGFVGFNTAAFFAGRHDFMGMFGQHFNVGFGLWHGLPGIGETASDWMMSAVAKGGYVGIKEWGVLKPMVRNAGRQFGKRVGEIAERGYRPVSNTAGNIIKGLSQGRATKFIRKILRVPFGSPWSGIAKNLMGIFSKPALKATVAAMPGIARGESAVGELVGKFLGRRVASEELSTIAGRRLSAAAEVFGEDITKLTRTQAIEKHMGKRFAGALAPGRDLLDTPGASQSIRDMLDMATQRARRAGATGEGFHLLQGNSPSILYVEGGRVQAFGTMGRQGDELMRGTLAVSEGLRGTDIGSTISQSMSLMGAVRPTALSEAGMAAYHKNLSVMAERARLSFKSIENNTMEAMNMRARAQTRSTVPGMGSTIGAPRGIRRSPSGGA